MLTKKHFGQWCFHDPPRSDRGLRWIKNQGGERERERERKRELNNRKCIAAGAGVNPPLVSCVVCASAGDEAGREGAGDYSD